MIKFVFIPQAGKLNLVTYSKVLKYAPKYDLKCVRTLRVSITHS